MSTPIRAGRVAVGRMREILSEREMGVLGSIADFRYLAARQIESLHFSGHASALTGARTCRRVLERLTKATLIFRLERRIGGLRAGSASFVYGLAPLGCRVLFDDDVARPRRREPSARFLDHTLAVAQFAVDLYDLARSSGFDILSLETEPSCWRTFTKGLGASETLKPDLLITLAIEEYEQHWFVEVDCASASTQAVLRKCRTYHDYWLSGLEQNRTGIFPRVLWVVPSRKREAQLKFAIESAARLNQDLFAVTPKRDAPGVAVGRDA